MPTTQRFAPSLSSEHCFHIPVMGTGFTNTTALTVAPLGVSSVIALADDTLLEQQRKALSKTFGVDYQPIPSTEDDSRARRTRAYLDLIADEVERRVAAVRASAFQDGSLIQRYFELLPETETKAKWRSLAGTTDPVMRARLESELRAAVIPGQIEVNIMTKLDSAFTVAGHPKPADRSDALASLRGFATSKLRSSVVFSAGMNPRLFAYAATLDCFFPDEFGVFDKRICLKVSDFRSAHVQATILAKKGLWVSEYRIESGLNCGGHAFPTEGQLLGPILDEFRSKRADLQSKLYDTFAAALGAQGRCVPPVPPPIRIAVQGGVGTATEQKLLLERYGVDSVGWGSAFLYCPEVIAIDDDTLGRLLAAKREDLQLSNSSPLGVPFWNLMTSKGEQARRDRIAAGKSGSPCPRGFVAFDTEFSSFPLCTASRRYHNRLKESLQDAPAAERKRRLVMAEAKSCLCGDLAGSPQIRLGIDANATPLVCAGPNALYFRRTVSFDEMVGHVYGRNDVLPADVQRPHVFLNELEIYIDYLEKEVREGLDTNLRKKWAERYRQGLENGITHLRALVAEGWLPNPVEFLATVERLDARLHSGEAVEPTSPPQSETRTREPATSISMSVSAAVAKLIAEPRFRRLARWLCGTRTEAVLRAADAAQTEREFQTTLGKEMLEALLQRTTIAVEHRVEEQFRQRPACLYVSNHRDIVLDTALLNQALISHEKPIPHVAIGDNLLQTDWFVPFLRLCRAFVIRRELKGKQLYEQSLRISKFVRDSIGRGEPVWLAQRPGRTKDGEDRTEPGLLRMLLLAYEREPIESTSVLNVTPVAVSYEYEPCDVFKAASLIGARTKNGSDDRARGDAAQVMRGLLQYKGRVCLTIRPPIEIDDYVGKSDASRTDLVAALAHKVDREIADGYAIWPTNYVAHDLLHGKREYADRYTDEQRDEFNTYVAQRATEIVAEPQDARVALLTLYAKSASVRSQFCAAS